jgi:MerR family transcriptional regulator/heat shock protein HspR
MAASKNRLPLKFDTHAPLFLISTAARLAGMHPQTLRTYDRMGLVTPQRTAGRGRRYSIADVERLRLIHYLTQDEGVNLVGVRQILDLQSQVDALQEEVVQLTEQLHQARTTTPRSRLFTASADEVWVRTTSRAILP